MRKGTTWIVSLLLVLLSGFTRAEEGRQSALTSWIERNLETSDGKIPGASVAVIRNYRIAWAQGFGQSNTELGTAVTPTTLFQACSISKAISALAAMIAFEDHKLGLDENISLEKALNGATQGRITPRIALQIMERQPGRLEPGSCLETADPGVKACQSSWGLGLDVNLNRYFEHQKDGEPTGGYFAHTGFNSGFLALMMGSKTGGNGVVIMLNMAPQDMSGPVPQFSFLQALVRRVADEEGWN